MLKREICSTLAVRNCLGSTQCFIRVDEGSLKRVHWTHDYLCGKRVFPLPNTLLFHFPPFSVRMTDVEQTLGFDSTLYTEVTFLA